MMENKNRSEVVSKRNCSKSTTPKSAQRARTKSKLSALAVGLLLSGSALGVTVVTMATFSGSIMQLTTAVATGIAAHTSAITSQITAMGAQLNTQILTYTTTVNDALKVATKQEYLNATNTIEVNNNANQSLANAYQTMKQKEDLAGVMMDYSSGTGQGYASCTVLAKNNKMEQAFDGAEANGQLKAADAQSSQLVLDTKMYNQDRIETHLREFCSVGEAKAGSCTLSTLPGGDSNAALLYAGANVGSKEELARRMLRESIAGKPMRGLKSNIGSSAAGQDYLYRTNEQASLMGFPSMSLAYIDAQNLRTSKDANGNPISANEMLENTVARYYGGPEATAWQEQMLKQEPRGLLVESARINGLSTWINQKMYEQNLRIEGNLAALALASAKPIKAKLDAKQRTVTRMAQSATMASYN